MRRTFSGWRPDYDNGPWKNWPEDWGKQEERYPVAHPEMEHPKHHRFALTDPHCKVCHEHLMELRNTPISGATSEGAWLEQHVKECPMCQAFTEKNNPYKDLEDKTAASGRECDKCGHSLKDEDFDSYGSWSYTCPYCGFRYTHGTTELSSVYEAHETSFLRHLFKERDFSGFGEEKEEKGESFLRYLFKDRGDGEGEPKTADLSGHSMFRLLDRLPQKDADDIRNRADNFANTHPSGSWGVRVSDCDSIKCGPTLSIGDSIVAIIRGGKVITLMYRRKTQPFTPEALRVDKVAIVTGSVTRELHTAFVRATFLS